MATAITTPRSRHTLESRVVENQVRFTQLQLDWLERMFPQRELAPGTLPDEVWHYFGTQRVVSEVRRRVQR